jgi:predicted AlkP superfamily phosphohydrolase/phosphomutase
MTKTALIGLDGATWDLLDNWLDAGRLPTLAHVREEGFSGTLKSTIPANTSPAVQSLYTGSDPATLGLFGFQKPDGRTFSLGDVTVPKIWTVLDAHDRSSCIVNVRTTFPPDAINGVMLSGDPMPGEESEYAHPPELKDEVTGFRCQEKDDRMHKELVPPYEHNDEVLQHAVDIFEHRFRTFRELATEEDHDFLMYWVGETDFLQHRLWNNEKDILAFYEVLDERIGEFLEGFDGNVIFLSDHGFEGPPSTIFYANEWIRQQGYLSVPGGRAGARILGVGQELAQRYVNKDLLMKILYRLQQGESGSEADTEENGSSVGINKPHLQIPGISASSTAQLATNCSIEIRAERGKRQIANELQSTLESLMDDDGRPVMKAVHHKEDLYDDGPYFDDVPDLLFEASEHVTIAPGFSNTVFERIPPNQRSGRGRHVYARDGVIFGTGPDLESAEGLEADITDVAPTILHLLGLPIADTMTGSVVSAICKDGEADVEVQNYAGGSQSELLDEGEQEEMEAWLEDMGYI